MTMVELRDVAFHYPDSTTLILDGISFNAEMGDTIAIQGRNGAGKSTLLKLIAGELQPTSGTISLARATRAIYLDQFAGTMLAEFLTLEEHLFAFSRRHRSGLARGQLRTKLTGFLSPFGIGLEARLRSFAGELSGGERQLLALAIALMADVQILCLDEFTASLDEWSEKAAYAALAAARENRPLIIFLVSHAPTPLKPMKLVSLSSRGSSHV